MAKSQFSKALGRELGKNTGKLISNKLFGNGHATPYRITAKVQAAEIRASGMKAQADALKAQVDADLEVERLKIQQENLALELSVVNEISNIELSQNPIELANQLNQIMTLLNGQQSRKIIKAGIEKIDFGVLSLHNFNPIQSSYFEKKVKKLKFRYNIPYYLLIICVLIFGLGVFFISSRHKSTQSMGSIFLCIGLFSFVFTIIGFFNKKNK